MGTPGNTPRLAGEAFSRAGRPGEVHPAANYRLTWHSSAKPLFDSFLLQPNIAGPGDLGKVARAIERSGESKMLEGTPLRFFTRGSKRKGRACPFAERGH
jgi:hypothetical protein